MKSNIEIIRWKNKILAYIVKDQRHNKTKFITPKEANLQVGFIVYPKKSEIPKHIHKPVVRKLNRTEEVIVVRKGKCRLDIYNENRLLATSRMLHKGDIIILVAGGHGFKVFENTIGSTRMPNQRHRIPSAYLT